MAKDWRHTWQYWGEERRQRSLKKTFDKWESEFEDMSETEEHESVFIIVNEYAEELNGMEGREDVSFWHTENNAWMDLFEIAKEFGVTLSGDDTSFEVPSGNLSVDTYYIEERQFND